MYFSQASISMFKSVVQVETKAKVKIKGRGRKAVADFADSAPVAPPAAFITP